jgi:hypothetical protein
MQLVNRLVALANERSHPLHVATNEGWTARPVAVSVPTRVAEFKSSSSSLGSHHAIKWHRLRVMGLVDHCGSVAWVLCYRYG